jgi:hypothetical protein
MSDDVIYERNKRFKYSLGKMRMDHIFNNISPCRYSAYNYNTQNIHIIRIKEEINPFCNTFINIYCTSFIPKLLSLSSVIFWLTPPSPPVMWTPPGSGFPIKINDFSKDSLLRSSCRDILPWRSSRERIPHSSWWFPYGFLTPEIVLGENVSKTYWYLYVCLTGSSSLSNP